MVQIAEAKQIWGTGCKLFPNAVLYIVLKFSVVVSRHMIDTYNEAVQVRLVNCPVQCI